MDFSLNEVQRSIQETAKKFAEKEIAPVVGEDERNSYFRKELFPKFGTSGLMGACAPVEFGGSGLGSLEYSLILEELSYHSTGYAVSFSVSNFPIKVISNFGTEEQKKKYLPPLISGEKLGALCLTEFSSGSDMGSLRTTARKEKDYYTMNGSKQFITNGEQADIFILLARTGESGNKGISAFIMEKAMDGFFGGKLEKKMGMRCSPTQEMILENVKVPTKNLLAQEGEGFKIAMKSLDSGRLSIASIANGLSRAASDKASSYAKNREQFGRPIINFQGISFLLVDMVTELEASVLLTRKANFLQDNNLPFTKEAAMAKLKSTESCMKITTNAVQVLGGYGYMEEYTVERYMREAKALELIEGTSQIQRLVISRNI